ncbi:hypothetical protein Tco_0348317 [Tanacetum coccineum]
MSDSEDSTVTYTQVSSPFEDSSDVGSPGVDGPPVMPEDPYAYIAAAYQAPPSPDYMPGPEEPQSPPPLDFVPEPMYPEYMPLEDEILPAEEQPLPAAASPTADSPGYVPESDPEEEPEADDDEDPEEDPADYPADRDDDDEEEEEPSGDDADDEDEDEDIAIKQLGFQFHTPLNLHSLLGYQAAMIRLRAEAASTSHSLPLPPPIILSHTKPDAPSSGTPPLHLLFTETDTRHDLERDIGYRITDFWDEIVEAMQGTLVVTDVVELSQRMTEFETRVKRDTDEVYTRLDDEQSGQQLLAGRLNMLFRDRRAHARTARLMETEARMSQEAWGRSMDASDLARAQTVITEMLAADHKRQVQLTKTLKLVKRLQTQMVELQRQQGPAKGPAQPELPEEAGSSS